MFSLTALVGRITAWARAVIDRLTAPIARVDPNDAELAALVADAEAHRHAGHGEAATALYRRVLERHRTHPGALRGLRDLAVAGERWQEAIALQARLLASVPAAERGRETEMLAGLHYELGCVELARGDLPAAIGHLKAALRVDRQFTPAALELGEQHVRAGDAREAVRTWERAVEVHPALPILARLERVYRDEGRPTRMIALYREATERLPDDLSLAIALGRVYLELEMLDEAADQFEKLEVRAPDSSAVHAYLGAVFERRGDTREAFEEYRRALRLGHGFDWPHRCRACTATTATWQERCPQCRRWNALRPVSAG